MFSPNSGVKVVDTTPSKGVGMDSPSMISIPMHSPPIEQTFGAEGGGDRRSTLPPVVVMDAPVEVDRSTPAVPGNAAIPSVLFHNAAFSYHFYAAHCARDDDGMV